MSDSLVRRPITDLERDRALALGSCRFSPGTFAKRWCHMMADRVRTGAATTITEKEAECLARMAWTFRRQLHVRLVPDVKPPERWPAATRVAAPAKPVPNWNPA